MAEQLRTTSASSHLKNRQIFKGSQNTTWPVPEGTTEVWVHVWGGGGGSTGGAEGPQPWHLVYGAGGGGGGYSRAIYYVTDTDTLSITVGGNGGTSSVTIPTQSPGSPISSTGGVTAGTDCTTAGTGGSGSITLHPTFPTYYCFTASGGAGGNNILKGYSGGGAAGSPLGVGGDGGTGHPGPGTNCAPLQGANAGGGIGGSNGVITMASMICTCSGPDGGGYAAPYAGSIRTFNVVGGSALQSNAQVQFSQSACMQTSPAGIQLGFRGHKGAVVGSVGHYDLKVATSETHISSPNPQPWNPAPVQTYCQRLVNYSRNTTSGVEWFYVEDIVGSSGYFSPLSSNCSNLAKTGDGAGGTASGLAAMNHANTNGGLLGGGGGRGCHPGYPNTGASSGGCAGGSGGTCNPLPGTPGAVILYW
jgi:hypothetical protein